MVIYILDWIIEGYGFNGLVIENFCVFGVEFLIMFDCGSMFFEVFEMVSRFDLDVVVVDYY